jgi:hypothetical protein
MGETEKTKAYKNFKFNFERLLDLVGFFYTQIDQFNSSKLPDIRDKTKEAHEAEDLYKKADHIGKYLSVKQLVEFQLQWYAVMLVTFTETYLQDVLAFSATQDDSIMKRSEQKADYEEVKNAKSVANLAEKLRMNWARNFLESGGPSHWIKRLKKMGARGYNESLPKKMEQLWGIRHMIVHRTGKASSDFVTRHPELEYEKGEKIIINDESFEKYSKAVIDFASITDKYFINRFSKK